MKDKRRIRSAIMAIAALGAVCLMIFLIIMGKSRSQGVCCKDVSVCISDSLECKFVTSSQVRKALRNSWQDNFIGLHSRDIKMTEMENRLKDNSAIRKADIYLTCDGILHVDILQRHPVAKFVTPSGVSYMDLEGVSFHLAGSAVTDALVFEGPAPLKDKDFVSETIDMCEWIDGHAKWRTWVKRVKVDTDGNLVLYPKEGKEQFIFGGPGGYEKKFKNIAIYYNKIKPDSPDIRIVNIKFDKRIICRKTY